MYEKCRCSICSTIIDIVTKKVVNAQVWVGRPVGGHLSVSSTYNSIFVWILMARVAMKLRTRKSR